MKQTILDASTGYVTQQDMELLQDGAQCIASYAEGAFVYLPAMLATGEFDDPDWRTGLSDEGFSKFFCDLIEYARQQDCTIIRLDRDGDDAIAGLTAAAMKAPYYADLNPEYPSRNAKRWVVLYRYDGGPVRRVDQFATRRAAEACAKRWNDAERDPEAPAW